MVVAEVGEDSSCDVDGVLESLVMEDCARREGRLSSGNEENGLASCILGGESNRDWLVETGVISDLPGVADVLGGNGGNEPREDEGAMDRKSTKASSISRITDTMRASLTGCRMDDTACLLADDC